jgi:hypothetical protein
MAVVGSKKCALCAEEIDTAAPDCPFCGARYQVTHQGYCTSCHRIVTPTTAGVCPHCDGALIDEVLDSRFIGAALSPRAVRPPEVLAAVPPPPALAALEAPIPAAAPAAPAVPEAPTAPMPAAAPTQGRHRWLPWVIVAAVLVAGGAGVLIWWLVWGGGGGTTISTVALPAEEVDPLSDYLVAVLTAEIPVVEASAAANAAGATGQAAAGQRGLAAAYGTYRERVAALAPPPSARAHQNQVLDLADGAVDLYTRAADATEQGDSPALIGLQSDLVAWMDLALEEATQRELLINTALSANGEAPLNRYLLDSGSVRSEIFDDLQVFLGEVQASLTAGQWQTTIDQIERELGIIDGFLASWHGLTPPPEATAYHTAQGDAVKALRDALAPLVGALEDQDLSSMQSGLLNLMGTVADAQGILMQRNRLIVQALGGPSGEPFPLAGTWSGVVSFTYEVAHQATVTIDPYCEAGLVCGSFELAEVPCAGKLTLVGQASAVAPYEFAQSDLTGHCTEGVRTFLKLLPEGTLQYTAVGLFDNETGVLSRE